LGKAIVSAQSSLSSNYCLRVTAEGANQNAQRPFFNTEIILNPYSMETAISMKIRFPYIILSTKGLFTLAIFAAILGAIF
jgi:hypothetical protein